MEILYEKKIGVYIKFDTSLFDNQTFTQGGPNMFKSTLPINKIKLYKEYLVIEVNFLVGKNLSIKINYSDIESIDKILFSIKINHTSQEAPIFIFINGATGISNSLYKELKNCSKDNNLPLKFNNLSIWESVKYLFKFYFLP